MARDPNPNIFPFEGVVFVESSPYIKQKLKKIRSVFQKDLIRFAFAVLVLIFLASNSDQPLNLSAITNLASLMLMLLAMVRGLQWIRYFHLKKLSNTNPLLRISEDGISTWENPDSHLSWQDMGACVLKASKIYILPRMAMFQKDRPFPPRMCIDTSLLKVQRYDMTAYLNERMKREHAKSPDVPPIDDAR